jgi:hypothetical protein
MAASNGCEQIPMTATTNAHPARLVAIFGLVLTIACPSLAISEHVRLQGRSRQLHDYLADAERSPAGPARDARIRSNSYHLIWIDSSLRNRWSATGYATIGVLGTLVGILCLYVSTRPSRSLTRPLGTMRIS